MEKSLCLVQTGQYNMSPSLGIIGAQIRKFAGYMPGGFDATGTIGFDGDNDSRQETGLTANNSYQKLLFISEATSQLPATLSVPTRAMAGHSNPLVAGYTLGGENASGSTMYSKIEKLTFNGESNSVLGATLTANTFAMSGGNNGSTAGYVFGGYSVSANTNRIDKLTFSNESNSALAATLAVSRNGSITLSNGPTAIYNAREAGATAFKLTLSNETTSTLAATLSQTHVSTQSATNLGVAGYMICRGGNPTPPVVSHHKLTYSNETLTFYSSGLSSEGMNWGSGFSYSNIRGYFMGGTPTSGGIGGANRRITKVEFSNDTYSKISSVMSEYKRQTQGYSHTN